MTRPALPPRGPSVHPGRTRGVGSAGSSSAEAGRTALRLPDDRLRDNADVAAITRLAADPGDLDSLDVYCATGSLRRAANLLHLHHSSVARRLERIGKTLGFELTEPTGAMRAGLALAAWRFLGESGR